MPNKQYYVQKDAKTEPPLVDKGFVLSAPYHLIMPDGPICVGRFIGHFKEWRHDGNKIEPSSYLAPCTDPLFTIEEVQERILKAASDAWDAAKESVVENACIEHDHVKNTEFVEVDYGVIEKDKQQFLEQLKQKK